MHVDFERLKASPRVLIEVDLKPVAGSRIQPTGFPDIGPAVYEAPDGTPTLLVESAQSMANRLEAVCWDEANDDVVKELSGLPFVRVKLSGLGTGQDTTTSLLEFHRLNSPYIMTGVTNDGKPFADVLTEELGLTVAKGRKEDETGDGDGKDVAGVINLRRLAKVCFKYDPNSLIHGVFLEKIAGRLRQPRALSSFIEASGVGRADSGGVKFDRALPKPSIANVDAKGGYGNVPFHRSEFTAKSITAFFSLDLAQLRGYGLPPEATEMLAVLSLWKVRKFLDSNMRLRTACELEQVGPEVMCRYKDAERNDQAFAIPSERALTDQLSALIKKCVAHFRDPAVTVLTWSGVKKSATKTEIKLPSDLPPLAQLSDALKKRVEYKKGTAKKAGLLVIKGDLTHELIAEIENEMPDARALIDLLTSSLEAASTNTLDAANELED
jgi:CRISPR-associated protein Csb1